jgi:hypothetical protein
MFPLVEFPEIVQCYAPFFETVFSADAFIEFKRYISGLIVSENKTVDGINRLFVVESRNQSSLNRLLTASPFSLEHLSRARLDLLARFPGTRIKPKGVLSVDDTLLTHDGQDFEQIAKLFDHVTQTYVWAHNLTWSRCTTAMTTPTTHSCSDFGSQWTWKSWSKVCAPPASRSRQAKKR